MNKKRVTITIDPDTHKNFKEHCEQRGMKISSKIELLMKETLENASNNKPK